MGGIFSTIYSSMFWVADDTQYVLPPMNIDPNFITVSGFSGGAYMTANMVTIYSSTFAAGMAVAGGPYGAGFKCSGELFSGQPEDCGDTWRADMITTI